jgi:hypothetical protein
VRNFIVHIWIHRFPFKHDGRGQGNQSFDSCRE